MRAKIIRPDIEVNELAPTSVTVTRESLVNGELQDVRYFRLGAVVEDPLAWKWVRNGIAEPADEECRAKARMTPHQLEQAQHAARRVTAGVHPRDFKKFDAGLMSGYLPDGSYRPGPNASEAVKQKARDKCQVNNWPLHAPWEIDAEGRPLEADEPASAADSPDTAEELPDEDASEDSAPVDLDRPGVY